MVVTGEALLCKDAKPLRGLKGFNFELDLETLIILTLGKIFLNLQESMIYFFHIFISF